MFLTQNNIFMHIQYLDFPNLDILIVNINCTTVRDVLM